MLEFPADISRSRILISNDDGVHSEGIKVLEEVACTLTPDVWVVAPETQQSGVGHSLTLHMPLRVRQYAERRYSVYGTPTDSVLVGAGKVMKGGRPDLVLSGINHGQNTADDVTYSGTIAAAIEGTLMGIPSVALSQDYNENGGRPEWGIVREYLPEVLRKLQGFAWERHIVISVNFPQPKPGVTPEIRVIPQGHYSMEKSNLVDGVDPSGRPYFWIGPPPERDVQDLATDVGCLNAGHVTITPLSLNLTHHPTLKALEKIF